MRIELIKKLGSGYVEPSSDPVQPAIADFIAARISDRCLRNVIEGSAQEKNEERPGLKSGNSSPVSWGRFDIMMHK